MHHTCITGVVTVGLISYARTFNRWDRLCWSPCATLVICKGYQVRVLIRREGAPEESERERVGIVRGHINRALGHFMSDDELELSDCRLYCLISNAPRSLADKYRTLYSWNSVGNCPMNFPT